jgi:hypothetical protein
VGVKLKRLRTRRSGQDDAAKSISALSERAHADEADGRLRDAVSAWTEVNRLHPDPDVEERLVRLRCELALGQARGSAPDQWPPTVDDPFPDVEGRVPDIDVDDLTSEVLGGAIVHHGCLLVRGMLAGDGVAPMRETIDRALAGRQEHLDGVPVAETRPWYSPCNTWDAVTPDKARNGRKYSDKSGSAVHACDSPRAIFHITELLENGPVLAVIAEYLGEHPVMSANKTMLRRVPPDAKPSWHQDGSFMGQQTRTVNLWLALSDCGEGCSAPGLALVPRRLDRSLRGEVSNGDIILTPDQFEEASGGIGAIRPTFAPGDALLFDELLAHANGGGQPGLSRPRYAVEAWLFAPSSVPAGYLPIFVG